MRTLRGTWMVVAALASAAAAVVACTGAQSGGGQGQLAVSMVDAPNLEYAEIWVNVDRVTARSIQGGWQTVSSTPFSVNLLTLQGTTALDLGSLNLPVGTVTEIRLILANQDSTIQTADGVTHPLKVPSGTHSGIKIKGPWEITACNKTAVTIDFDGKSSIWYHPTGQGDEWILRPVIRVKKAEQVAIACPDGATDGGADAGALPPPPPPPASAGATCAVTSDCLSTLCYQQKCAPGGAGAPCAAAGDCVSGTCGTDGTCAAAPTGLPVGAVCTDPTQCTSNSCAEGTCDPGLQGATCNAVADCAPNYQCSGGTCYPPAAM